MSSASRPRSNTSPVTIKLMPDESDEGSLLATSQQLGSRPSSSAPSSNPSFTGEILSPAESRTHVLPESLHKDAAPADSRSPSAQNMPGCSQPNTFSNFPSSAPVGPHVAPQAQPLSARDNNPAPGFHVRSFASFGASRSPSSSPRFSATAAMSFSYRVGSSIPGCAAAPWSSLVQHAPAPTLVPSPPPPPQTPYQGPQRYPHHATAHPSSLPTHLAATNHPTSQVAPFPPRRSTPLLRTASAPPARTRSTSSQPSAGNTSTACSIPGQYNTDSGGINPDGSEVENISIGGSLIKPYGFLPPSPPAVPLKPRWPMARFSSSRRPTAAAAFATIVRRSSSSVQTHPTGQPNPSPPPADYPPEAPDEPTATTVPSAPPNRSPSLTSSSGGGGGGSSSGAANISSSGGSSSSPTPRPFTSRTRSLVANLQSLHRGNTLNPPLQERICQLFNEVVRPPPSYLSHIPSTLSSILSPAPPPGPQPVDVTVSLGRALQQRREVLAAAAAAAAAQRIQAEGGGAARGSRRESTAGKSSRLSTVMGDRSSKSGSPLIMAAAAPAVTATAGVSESAGSCAVPNGGRVSAVIPAASPLDGQRSRPGAEGRLEAGDATAKGQVVATPADRSAQVVSQDGDQGDRLSAVKVSALLGPSGDIATRHGSARGGRGNSDSGGSERGLIGLAGSTGGAAGTNDSSVIPRSATPVSIASMASLASVASSLVATPKPAVRHVDLEGVSYKATKAACRAMVGVVRPGMSLRGHVDAAGGVGRRAAKGEQAGALERN